VYVLNFALRPFAFAAVDHASTASVSVACQVLLEHRCCALHLLCSGSKNKPRFGSIEVAGFVSWLSFSERLVLCTPRPALTYREHANPLRFDLEKSKRSGNCATVKLLLLCNSAHSSKKIERGIRQRRLDLRCAAFELDNILFATRYP
jgi:hypothetical protein